MHKAVRKEYHYPFCYDTREKLPRIYVCRKCKNKYTVEEFDENRFCRDCGTFLSVRVVSYKDVPKRKPHAQAVAVKTKDSGDPWLPNGYEVRKGQVDFIKEATKALENNEIFIGSAPCGIGKSLASLISVLPVLENNKLLISFRTRSQLHIFLKELRGLKKTPLTVSFFSKQVNNIMPE